MSSQAPSWMVALMFMFVFLAVGDTWVKLAHGCSLYRLLAGPKNRRKQLLSELSRIRAQFPSVEIHTDVWVPGLSRMVSAVIFLRRGKRGAVLFYEVAEKNNPTDFWEKANELRNWEGGAEFLSQLLGFPVPCYGVLGSPTIDTFLGR